MSYGATTDPWGFAADANIKLQSSSANPSDGGEGQCVDSIGDVAASTMYDTANSTISAVYKTCSDTALVLYHDTTDTSKARDFRLGKVISNNVITSIEVTTSPTERPTITISGEYAHGVTDGAMAKYDPSDVEIVGVRKATPIAFTADSKSKVTGASVTASVSTSKTADSVGNTACMDVYGGRVEATTDIVGCTGAPGGTVAGGWTQNSGPGSNQGNTAYATGSLSAFKNLTAM